MKIKASSSPLSRVGTLVQGSHHHPLDQLFDSKSAPSRKTPTNNNVNADEHNKAVSREEFLTKGNSSTQHWRSLQQLAAGSGCSCCCCGFSPLWVCCCCCVSTYTGYVIQGVGEVHCRCIEFSGSFGFKRGPRGRGTHELRRGLLITRVLCVREKGGDKFQGNVEEEVEAVWATSTSAVASARAAASFGRLSVLARKPAILIVILLVPHHTMCVREDSDFVQG